MIKVVETKWENVIEDASYVLEHVFGICDEILQSYDKGTNKYWAVREVMSKIEERFGVRYENDSN